MKNKIIVLVSIVAVLVVALWGERLLPQGPVRTHQHRVNAAPAWDGRTSHLDASAQGALSITMDSFKTHLPVISIDTRGQVIPGLTMDLSIPWIGDDEWSVVSAQTVEAVMEALEMEGQVDEGDGPDKIQASIAFYDGMDDGREVNPFQEEAKIDTDALISYRGNSSRSFPKKGLSIKLIKPNGAEDHREVFGMSRHNEWVLHGPYLDKTLLRNYLMYNISGEIMEYAPNVRFCEAFIDGEYQGVFLLVEKITTSDHGRIPITRNRTDDRVTSYIIESVRRGYPDGRSVPMNYSRYAYILPVSAEFEIRSPAYRNITPAQLQYIQDDISRFEKSLYSYDYANHENGYKTIIDVDNFADYVILSLFSGTTDAGEKSTYIYKDPRGKLSLCVWDFNNVFDNFFVQNQEYNEFFLTNRPWFDRLLRDEDFNKTVVRRYNALREGALNEEYLLSYIDETIAYLGPAIERNYSVWATSFLDENNLLIPGTRNIHSFDEAVAHLKEQIIKNGAWFDQNIETIYQFSHESAVKKYNP